jgi:hypothetical protein
LILTLICLLEFTPFKFFRKDMISRREKAWEIGQY